jgi:hypothetical protein
MAPKPKVGIPGFGRRLSWKDYTPADQPPAGYSFDAGTHTDVRYRYQWRPLEKGGWKIKHVLVSVEFSHKKSWIVKGRQAEELLRHEQLHYMISSIGARQLLHALSDLSGDGSQSADFTCNEIVAKMIGDDHDSLLSQVQDRYDEAFLTGTQHSQNKHQQILWDHEITKVHGDPNGKLEKLYYFMVPGDYEVLTGSTRDA